MSPVITVKWAPYEELSPDLREVWWAQLISEATEEATEAFRGEDPSAVAVAERLLERLRWLESEPCGPCERGFHRACVGDCDCRSQFHGGD